MAYESLEDYISTLRKHNQLVQIDKFVNPNLEITEIADRFSKQNENNNKALLFTNTGTEFPVIINALGNEKRICLALNCNSLDDHQQRIEQLITKATSPKKTLWEKLALLPMVKELNSWMPKQKKGKAACQEVVMSYPDLSKLPILQCWPHDGGKFITFPMVFTKNPTTQIPNVGMYRMQVIDNQTTAMHWHLHKTGANHYNEYKRLNKKMPVSVALGGDPAHTFAATAPLPENIDECMLSGFLRQKHVELVKCKTNNLLVPADADFIIEGYVDPSEELFYEGPFGDHTGFYSLPDYYPKFHVTCITHKKNAIYPCTIVGIPPMEDAWIGKATERIFLAPIKFLLIPEMIDYHMPFEGVAHNLVIAKIKKSFAGQAFKVMNTLWGAGQMMFNKTLIVVDENCDIFNYNDVLQAVLQNCNLSTDICINKGPLDVLDHAAPLTGFGSKIGFDATNKTSEHNKLQTPNTFLLIPANINTSIAKMQKQLNENNSNQIIIVYDDIIASKDFSTICWHVLNNISPIEDCTLDNSNFYIDGRTKKQPLRDWPNPVTSNEETIKNITNNWKSYCKDIPLYESPSSHYKSIVRSDSAWHYKQ